MTMWSMTGLKARLHTTLTDFRNDFRGVAAIEFGFLSAVLVLLLIMTVDLGLGFYYRLQVQTSAQTGAMYAAVNGFDATKISQVVVAATATSGVQASPSPAEFCGCPSTTGVATATCNSTCSDGFKAGTYVSVTAAKSYTTLIPYPALPASYNFTSTSTVRTK